MRALLLVIAALVTLPHAAKCEKAVKGEGPVLVMVSPDYPYAARDRHLEGSGLYRINIKPDGTVASITILKSAGDRLLDYAAMHAFVQWRFRPGVLTSVKVPLQFSMKGIRYNAFRSSVSAQSSSGASHEPKAVAIYAPRPDYPVEARERGFAGSGVALLDVNPRTGEVVSVRMEKSMGHAMLDQAALAAFSRWRFKAPCDRQMRIPISYVIGR